MSSQNVLPTRDDSLGRLHGSNVLPDALASGQHEPSVTGLGSIEMTQLQPTLTQSHQSQSHNASSSSSEPSGTVNNNASGSMNSSNVPLVNGAVQSSTHPHGQTTNTPISVGITTSSGAPGLTSPNQWVSKWLHTQTILAMIAVTLLLIGVIIGLCIWSKLKQGIASVDLTKEYELFGISDFQLGISLSWTFVPVLIIQVYVLIIAALVRAASERQPYIELRRPRPASFGAPPEKSIFLDYQSYWAIEAPYWALKHNHYMLAYSFSITLLGSIFLTALVAHLFVARATLTERDTNVDRRTYFDELSFGARSDITPVLDIVAATRIFGGRPTNWTTLDKSFLPISLEGVPNLVNMTLPTQSLSATLNCDVVETPYQFEFGHTSNGWEFLIADRGCQFSEQTFTSQTYRFVLDYINTYTNQSCGSTAQDSRFAVVAAISANPSALDSSTSDPGFKKTVAISCIPEYLNQLGVLSVSIGPFSSDDLSINGFVPTGHGPMHKRPAFAANFELQMSQGAVLDDTAAVYGTNFGRLIYEYAKTIEPNSYFDGDVLRRAIEELYSSAFAVMANRYLVQPAQQTSITTHIYEAATHLYVILPVACTILAILILILIMLIWVLVYSGRRTSTQYEQSVGLVGSAATLRNSDLINRLQSIPANGCNGKVADTFIRQAPSEEGWTFVNWSSPGTAAIRSTQRAEKYGFRYIGRR